MPNTVLIGAQWGDEGKGKIIDVLTENADWVVRYQGGNNAGHTVEIGEERYVLHLIPSGILHTGKKCVIGNGVVIDPIGLVGELDGLAERDIVPANNFFISDRAHVVVAYHRQIDECREGQIPKEDKIGTTKRGIGPAYGDKAARTGLRMIDLVGPNREVEIRRRIEEANLVLKAYQADALDVEQVMKDLLVAADRLAPFICDTIPLLNQAMEQGEQVLFEGAQGTMLDIDYGTYPFVTSSHPTSGGACVGAGVAPNKIDKVLGVVKAYTTRVGEGPFPTELFDEDGEHLRKIGREFGATTGRPRRCGWFDAVVARYAVMINGIDEWAMTKLDVLDEFDVLKICVAYEMDGKRINTIPANINDLARCVPIYEEFPGWKCESVGINELDKLPVGVLAYIHRIEEITGVPVGIYSTGPGREDTIVCQAQPVAV